MMSETMFLRSHGYKVDRGQFSVGVEDYCVSYIQYFTIEAVMF